MSGRDSRDLNRPELDPLVVVDFSNATPASARMRPQTPRHHDRRFTGHCAKRREVEMIRVPV
jgi:hypothetical protein